MAIGKFVECHRLWARLPIVVFVPIFRHMFVAFDPFGICATICGEQVCIGLREYPAVLQDIGRLIPYATCSFVVSDVIWCHRHTNVRFYDSCWSAFRIVLVRTGSIIDFDRFRFPSSYHVVNDTTP